MLIVYSIVAGFVITLITFTLESQLPNEESISLQIWEQFGKIDACNENQECIDLHSKSYSQLQNALELRQNYNSALWTGKILGGFFIVGVPLLTVFGGKIEL